MEQLQNNKNEFKELKDTLLNKILYFAKKHSSLFLASLSGVFAIFFTYIKLCYFIFWKSYQFYFSIQFKESIQITDNLLFDILLSALAFLFIFVCSYFAYLFFLKAKLMKYLTIFLIVFYLSFLLYFSIVLKNKISQDTLLPFLIILLFFSITITFILHSFCLVLLNSNTASIEIAKSKLLRLQEQKYIKHKKIIELKKTLEELENKHNISVKKQKTFIYSFLVIFILASFPCSFLIGQFYAKEQKQFKVVSNAINSEIELSKEPIEHCVVLYESKDFFIIAPCKIFSDSKSVIVYYENQIKISSNNCFVTTKQFNKIEFNKDIKIKASKNTINPVQINNPQENFS